MHDSGSFHAPHHHHYHDNDASGASREEACALLGYMVAHNEHHAEELSQLAESMRGLGMADVAEEIEGALMDITEGNLKLRAAFALIKEG